MNENLFLEFSTALSLILSLFSATGVFDKPVTCGNLIRHRNGVLVKALAVSHYLSLTVIKRKVITTCVVAFLLLAS